MKISDLLIDYSSIIDSLEQYTGLIKYQKKRSIFSKIEDELISKYGYHIKKLKKSQGRILIRLVDRETSRTSFALIKDFRNIFSAGFWQLTARVFGHTILSEYDPNDGEDLIIEYIINEIENEIEFRIESSFNSISVHFSEIFETLFPGGKGSLSFTDKENILETGIDISVQPKGKKVKKLSLLSGGERSLAAIAFLFSIFKSFPSPFYILDEVEAALDDANLHRMINLLKHVKNDAQYIIVTHQQQTMHAGDVLYGVTMEPGSGSRVFTKTKADFEELIKKS